MPYSIVVETQKMIRQRMYPEVEERAEDAHPEPQEGKLGSLLAASPGGDRVGSTTGSSVLALPDDSNFA